MKRLLLLILALALPLLPQPRSLAQSGAQIDTRAALQRLLGERGDLDLRLDPHSATPAYLHGSLQPAAGDPQTTAAAFFRRYGAVWGIGAAEQMLRLTSQRRDRLGYTSLRFEQRAAGVAVFDTDLRVQIDPDGLLSTVNGRLLPNIQPPALRPQLDQAAALRRAQALHPGSLSATSRPPRLGILRTAGGADRLAWELWLLDPAHDARWQLRIDALDGALLSQQNVLSAARDRRTFDAQSSTGLPGIPVRSETQPPVADPVVNAAHDNAGRVYDYYQRMFGRDSLDGQGLPIVSSVHYGQQINNAYWDPVLEQMIYGDGDGVRFAPLGNALDVVAHELTHGVTEYSAGLSYQGQPGALNESFSDIFGMLIDDSDWQIAETVYTPGLAGDALRSAVDPTRYGDAGVWGQFLTTGPNLDNGAIHSNSGIFNHIAYEIGTTIGRPKAAQLFYRTLTEKLTFDSDFIVARDLTIQSCDELIGSFGISDQDCADVRMAFIRSGLGQPSQIAQPARLTNPVFLPLVLERTSGVVARLTPLMATECGRELVRNGGFEDGLSGWATDLGSPLIDPASPARSGERSATLSAGYQLIGYVRLPADVQQVVIQFNVRRAGAAEPAQQTLDVRAEISDGTTFSTLATLATLTGAQPGDTWLSYRSTLDVAGLRDLRLFFGDRYGVHIIDDVSIVAGCTS